MHSPHENDIRDRAYALWVEAGSPEGRDEEFWHQAESELAEQGDVDSSEGPSAITQPPLVAGLPIH